MKSMKAVFHNGIELTSKDVIDVVKIEEIISKYDNLIDTFGYRLHSIGPKFFKNITSTYTSSYSRVSGSGIGVLGISPYLFDSIDPKITSIFMQTSGLSLSEQLYSHNGTYSAGVGHAHANTLNIISPTKNKMSPFLLNIERTRYLEYFKINPRFILDSSPFSMSKRQKPGWGFQMLVSIPSYLGYASNLDIAFKDLPYDRWQLKLKSGVSKEHK